MQGFTKLFSSITTSSVWCHDDKTRLVWITLLALADRTGKVWTSVPGLAHIARVDRDDCDRALKLLAEKDDDSRTKDFEGRRIAEIDGGFQLLNYLKYRNLARSADRTEYLAEKQREHRAKKASVNMSTNVNPHQPIAEAEAEAEAEESTREGVAPAPARKKKPGAGRPESVEEVKTYWSEKSLKGDPLQFYDHYDANGWMMGKAHIKSWSAAARNWSRNEATFGPPKPPPTGNPPKATGSTDAEFDFQNRKRWRMEADMKKRFSLRDSGLPIEKIKNEMEKYQLDLDKKYGTDTTEFTA